MSIAVLVAPCYLHPWWYFLWKIGQTREISYCASTVYCSSTSDFKPVSYCTASPGTLSTPLLWLSLESWIHKPGGTVQKSTVYLGSEYLGLSFLTSLNHQLFKNIAYVGYFGHFVICCICVFVYLRICICVFVYLTVQRESGQVYCNNQKTAKGLQLYPSEELSKITSHLGIIPPIQWQSISCDKSKYKAIKIWEYIDGCE